MKKQVWSQGDLVIIQEPIPIGLAEQGSHDGIFARGEATGHAHRIIKGEARFFLDGSTTRAWALTDLEIGHEDHPSIRIPAGTQFRYHQEREADWLAEVNRNVVD